MTRRPKRPSGRGVATTPDGTPEEKAALDVHSAAYVTAGQRIRCPRCGDVHALEKRDKTKQLYVVCGEDIIRAADEHWLDPSAFGEYERIIDLTDESGEPKTVWERRRISGR